MDRLKSWETKELPDYSMEGIARAVAEKKFKEITKPQVAAQARAEGEKLSDKDLELITQRANEHMAVMHAEHGRPARSTR